MWASVVFAVRRFDGDGLPRLVHVSKALRAVECPSGAQQLRRRGGAWAGRGGGLWTA